MKPTETRSGTSHPPGSDLSRLRGADQRKALPSPRSQGSLGGADGRRGSGKDSTSVGRKGDSSSRGAGSDGSRGNAGDARKGLARKLQSDPKAGRDILKKGQLTTAATDIATRTAAGVGAGIATGAGATSCFWDPCFSDPVCDTTWNWWCAPSWCWGFSTWCSPWWGFGWGFGYCSDWWWYGGYYPYYGYCAPYPAYYSTVIYDSYDAPPAEQVVYVDPGYADEGVPVAQGEGSIQVAGQESSGLQPSNRGSASQFLGLGDQAFWEGRYSEAVHYYAKAVELEPEHGVLHLILSDALFATGDYHYAAHSLRRALDLDPTVVDSVVDKHKFYRDPAEFDQQVQLLESYLGDHFLDDDARLLLSANYLFGGQPAQAADLLQSPFSVAIRDSGAGKILLERAQTLRRARESDSSPR